MAEISVSRFININNFNLAKGKFTGAKPAGNLDAESWHHGEDPLLSYSRLWYKHIQQADAIDRSKAHSAKTQQISRVLRVQSHRLFCKEFFQSFQNWHYLIKKQEFYFDGILIQLNEEKTSPIIMASLAGLSNNVRRLLDDGADIDGDVEVNSNHKSTLDLSTRITRPIHAAALSGNLEILRLLLERGATLNQSELDMVVRDNVRHGVDVLTEILRDRPVLKITDNTVTASATNRKSREMLSYILDYENHLTPSQLVFIARNFDSMGQNRDLIEKVISYGERIECDSDEMLIAFLRWSACGYNIKIVLDRYQPPNSMTNAILQAVFENRRGTHQMMEFVFRYYRDVGIDIHISPGMLDLSQNRIGGAEMFKIILDGAKTVVVGTETLQSLGQTSEGLILMHLLLDHENCGYEDDFRASTLEIVSSVKRHLSICAVKVTDETMQLAAQLDEIALEILRKNARPNVIFPSADEVKDLMEKRRIGTLQQGKAILAQQIKALLAQRRNTILAQMPSSEPALVTQSKDS